MKAHKLVKTIQNGLMPVLLGLASSAFGQVESGRFVGHITDVQGAGVPHAIVKATNTGTNIVQSAITDSSGDFVITPVSAGVYSLSVSAAGFQTINASNIEVQVGQIVREDLEMKVGEATTTIEVYTEVPLLSTDSATLGTVMTNQQVTDLPLNGRGFYRLAELTPGAALLPPTGNSLAIRPEIVNGNTISGIRGSAISFLLDGVDVSDPEGNKVELWEPMIWNDRLWTEKSVVPMLRTSSSPATEA